MDEKYRDDDAPAAQRCLLDDAVSEKSEDDAILKALWRAVKQGQPSAFEALLDRFGTSALARPPATREREQAVRGAYAQKQWAGSEITEDDADEYDLLRGGEVVLERIFGDADKLEFCKVLLKHGWDPNENMTYRGTPLR